MKQPKSIVVKEREYLFFLTTPHIFVNNDSTHDVKAVQLLGAVNVGVAK